MDVGLKSEFEFFLDVRSNSNIDIAVFPVSTLGAGAEHVDVNDFCFR